MIIGSKDEEIICQKIKSDFPDVINWQKTLLDLAKLSNIQNFRLGTILTGCIWFQKGGKNVLSFTKLFKVELCSPVGDNVSIFHYNGNDNSFLSEVLKSIKSKLSL